jgi:hypothetical protein
MSMEETTKFKNALWWIASIAVSVLCCSVLFILFASYLVEVKTDIRDTNMRLNTVERREDRILVELETLRKHDMPAQAATAPVVPDAQGIAVPASGDAPATPPAAASDISTAPAPAVTSPASAPPPPITVPAISTPSENK